MKIIIHCDFGVTPPCSSARQYKHKRLFSGGWMSSYSCLFPRPPTVLKQKRAKRLKTLPPCLSRYLLMHKYCRSKVKHRFRSVSAPTEWVWRTKPGWGWRQGQIGLSKTSFFFFFKSKYLRKTCFYLASKLGNATFHFQADSSFI